MPTPSSSDGTQYPSNPDELAFARQLMEELKEMGVQDVSLQEGVVYASIPSNLGKDDFSADTGTDGGASAGAGARYSIGFIAHMDTVCEPGQAQVCPQTSTPYAGGAVDVKRSGEQITDAEFPQLKGYTGDRIITSDGTSILGADDKAGIAEIMEAAAYICSHPEFKHGKVGIAFTPDEEQGHGTDTFDVPRFGCDFAYTVDGEEVGEISYETFNAAAFTVTIEGRNCHPGSAKGMMINAVTIATDFISALPASERPETTEWKEGYYFVNRIEGSVDKVVIEGIIRDHDRDSFESRKQTVRDLVQKLNETYGGTNAGMEAGTNARADEGADSRADADAGANAGRIKLEMYDEYYNCAEKILPHYHLIENAVSAMEKEGIVPKVIPVRGGTDGSMLSYKGLPCPNLGTGGLGAHSLKEFIPVQCMEKTVKVILDIISAYAEKERE